MDGILREFLGVISIVFPGLSDNCKDVLNSWLVNDLCPYSSCIFKSISWYSEYIKNALKYLSLKCQKVRAVIYFQIELKFFSHI